MIYAKFKNPEEQNGAVEQIPNQYEKLDETSFRWTLVSDTTPPIAMMVLRMAIRTEYFDLLLLRKLDYIR